MKIELVEFGDGLHGPIAEAAFRKHIPDLGLEGQVDVNISGLYIEKPYPLEWIRGPFRDLVIKNRELMGPETADMIVDSVDNPEVANSREHREVLYGLSTGVYGDIIDLYRGLRDRKLQEAGITLNDTEITQFPRDPKADLHLAVHDHVVPWSKPKGTIGRLRNRLSSTPEVQTMSEASGMLLMSPYDNPVLTAVLGDRLGGEPNPFKGYFDRTSMYGHAILRKLAQAKGIETKNT